MWSASLTLRFKPWRSQSITSTLSKVEIKDMLFEDRKLLILSLSYLLGTHSFFSSFPTVQQEIFVSEKFRQKRPSGSSSGIYFRQTSAVTRLLTGCSVVALLLSVYFHIHECFWSNKSGFVKKFSQEFNFVKKLFWRKQQN